jgi:hypothetical protein
MHSTTLYDWATANATLVKLAVWLKPRLLAGHSYTLTLEEARRTGDQNDKLHAMLSDIAQQVEWSGQRWSVEDWKRLLTYAWMRAEKQSAQIVPAVDGHGFDVLYRRTSRLSKKELASLIDYIYAWAAEQNVNWSETQ